MRQFFSCVSDGSGKIYYFDHELRKKCLSGELDYDPDSHTSIADYYGFKGEQEDSLNKYEYNPITKQFVIDQLNTTDDSNQVEKLCNELDFKTIVPSLNVKDIIHPFKVKPPTEITDDHVKLLRQWDSVWDSVGDSVWDSVRDSVWDSVGASVWTSVWDSVRDSVWDSVWDSVRDSVRAYTGSFFDLEEWKYVKHEKSAYPYAPLVALWEQGLVPSFDGKTWRLHGGANADVLWEGSL